MPYFAVVFTQEVEFLVKAESLIEAEDAADRMAEDGDVGDHDGWTASVRLHPATPEAERDCDQAVLNGRIVHISDYDEATEKQKNEPEA